MNERVDGWEHALHEARGGDDVLQPRELGSELESGRVGGMAEKSEQSVKKGVAEHVRANHRVDGLQHGQRGFKHEGRACVETLGEEAHEKRGLRRALRRLQKNGKGWKRGDADGILWLRERGKQTSSAMNASSCLTQRESSLEPNAL